MSCAHTSALTSSRPARLHEAHEARRVRAHDAVGEDDVVEDGVAHPRLGDEEARHLDPVVGPRLDGRRRRSEEHTSELQSQSNLVCRLLLEKKKKQQLRTLTIVII